MEMTNSETLKAALDYMNSNEMTSKDQLNAVLLTSIASSLAIIADELHKLNSKGDEE